LLPGRARKRRADSGRHVDGCDAAPRIFLISVAWAVNVI
jgi:hypothetical protein